MVPSGSSTSSSRCSPPKREERLKPYVFIGPAIAAIAVFLIFPAVQTVQGSFYNADLSKPVGFQNYVNLFTKDPDFKSTLVNTCCGPSSCRPSRSSSACSLPR